MPSFTVRATDSLYKPLDCKILIYSPQMLMTIVKIPNKLNLLKKSLMAYK